ncbi:MAG TPA: hypothetical protein VHB21_17245, partial [Minicystis sp.]|nr:hypothetical protein [Minicystis sp.]
METLTREQKAACLDALPADRLRTLLDKLDLRAADRRSRAALTAALAAAPFADLLPLLRLPELRDAAAAVGVDAKGNKPLLIERVLRAGGVPLRAASAPPAARVAASGRKSALRAFALQAAAGF